MSEREQLFNELENTPDFLQFIDRLNADAIEESQPLPTDFAQNLDHYLYGIPKELPGKEITML